ncbi:ABC transporter substrate-binding protein [Mycetocola tolaasinivorans]|uniref:ABC transporter substrate-binding protein n=1 Tax=Mycetocola tolaasinivorans TaxID=76635 RepID=A0A3L7A617_9MICO|nr:zinc ABC transporter substrate-binding protein [Mycetocola tolaasinivorans]RLP75270.1 ABC transporter substrate-binding protein [Mycetocola tolaasinivorans]
MKKRLLAPLVALPALALVLSGCSAPGNAEASGDSTAPLTVVASTSVYGSIAQAILGDHGTVTSLISSVAQDPHSYEATAQDSLAISKADVVIKNGGGYDDFMNTLLDAHKGNGPKVVDAAEASGLLPGHEAHDHDHDAETAAPDDSSKEAAKDHDEHNHVEGFNEHVWYSFEGVKNVAHDLTHVLGDARPAEADAFHKNYDTFAAKLDELTTRVEALKPELNGKNAAITEPVPMYLLDAAGMNNVTPAEYSEAIEEGTDVSPAVMQATLQAVGAGDVLLLAYNDQTSGPETEQVRKAAEAAGVAVVDFTETLPNNKDYVSWMQDNIDNLAKVAKK